jgi:hypothetical protein
MPLRLNPKSPLLSLPKRQLLLQKRPLRRRRRRMLLCCPQNFQLDMDDVAPEDPDIAPKDLSGVVTEAEDMEEPEPAPREKLSDAGRSRVGQDKLQACHLPDGPPASS